MFLSITWTGYLITITVLALLYYAAIGWLYYRKDISALLIAGKQAPGPQQQAPQHASSAQTFMDGLSAAIQKAAQNKEPRPELIFGLQQVIKNHLAIRQIVDEDKVNEYIAGQLAKYEGHILSEEELKQLWKP